MPIAKVTDRIEWASIDPRDKGIKRGTVAKLYEKSVLVEFDKEFAKKVDRTVVAHKRYKIIEEGSGTVIAKKGKKQNMFNPDNRKVKKEGGSLK